MTRKEKIIKLYALGYRIPTIANKAGCSTQYVHNVLKKAGRK